MNTEQLKGWLSSSSQLVAASAQLAKTQAELATLNNVTLPRLYHAIGKRIVGSANLPPDLVPHREKIRELGAAIAKKPEEQKSEPASGFAAKAKQLAQQAASKTAKATADAAASMKIQAAYVALGRQAIEKYGPKALPQELREQYEAAMQKQAALADEIGAIKSASGKRNVTPGRLFLAGVATCVVLGFLGLRSITGWVIGRPNDVAVAGVSPSPKAEGHAKSDDDQTVTPERRATQANPHGPESIESLPRLTADEAQKLISQQDPTFTLELPGVKRLSAEAARVLAEYPANLHFPDLEVLDADAAEELYRNRGVRRSNSGLRIKSHLNLGVSSLKTLSAPAAAGIAKGHWDILNISGDFFTLTDEAAIELGKFKGLLWLTNIDMGTVAQRNVQQVGDLVVLGGLKTIASPMFVKQLCDTAEKSGEADLFFSCEEITPAAADCLCANAGNLRVRMYEIARMQDEAARLLLEARRKGMDLIVSGPIKSSATGYVKQLIDECTP